MSGCNKFTPNQCCGCVVKSHQLFPDFYSPDIICFKRYRERISVHTLTTQLTRTWVSGVQSNNTVTLVNTTDVTDDTVDSITTESRAGRFEWVFPAAVVPFGPFVVESETGTPGVNGTRTWAPRTQITTNRSVWEEYRLVMRYDVSDQDNFGRRDAANALIIKAATARLGGSQYTLPGWTSFNPNTSGSDLRHQFGVDADMPETPAEFDTLWASGFGSASYTAGTVTNFSILTRLPIAPRQSMFLLWYSTTARRGFNIAGTGALTIWDRDPVPLPTVPYDWRRDWIREDFQTWTTRELLPGDNFQVSLATLLPTNFWNTANRKLKVTFYIPADDPDDEEILAEQELAVLITGSANPYRWSISSDGHWGAIDHFAANHHQAAFPIVGVSPFGSSSALGPMFKLRGSVWEITGGRRIEDGVAATYQFVPYWHGLIEPTTPGGDELPLPRIKVRIKIISDNPQQRIYDETGLQHIDDGKKMLCPGNYTCAVIDDYAHPEWRVISHSLPGLNDSRPPLQVSHSGCVVTTSTAPRQLPMVIDYTTYTWQVSFNATYEPTARNIFNPSRFYFDGNLTNLSGGKWPGNRSGPLAGRTQYSDNVVNKIDSAGWYFPRFEVRHDYSGGATTAVFGTFATSFDSLPTSATVADRFDSVTFEGLAIHATGSWDTSNSSHYSVTVTTRDPYTSTTVSGLPPWTTSSGGAIRIGQELLIADGLGAGLVFKCTGLASFAAGVPTFAFEPIRQFFLPTLSAVPSGDDLADYSGVLGGYEYWVLVQNETDPSDDGLYAIASSGISGPDDELPDPSPIADDPVVEVMVVYSAVCYIAGTEEESEIAYEDHQGTLINQSIGVVGEPPLDNPVEDYDFPPTIVDLPTFPNATVFTCQSVYVSAPDPVGAPFGVIDGQSAPTTYTRPIRPVVSVTTINEPVTLTNFDGSTSVITHREYALGPEFDYTWNLTTVTRSGLYSRVLRRITHPNLGNSPASYAVAKTVTMVKVVPRWKDRELPTLTYNGDEAFVDINYSTGALVSNDFWKVNTIEVANQEFIKPFGVLDDVPPTNHVRIKYTRQRIYMDELTLTIGPSTYEPPEPL